MLIHYLVPVEVGLKMCTSASRHEEMHKQAWPSFSESMDWVILSKYPITSRNVLLHELNEGASTDFFKSTIRSLPSTVAFLVVNPYNALVVDRKFFPKDECLSVPFFVVTKEVGAVLSELVEENTGNVEVKIELKEAGTAGQVSEVLQTSGENIRLICLRDFQTI